MRKATRARLFWVAVVLLVCIPTAMAIYLTFLKRSGGLADRIALQISKGIGMTVKLGDVEFPRLNLTQVVLRRASIQNPLRTDYPFFESDEIVVDGFSTSEGVRADRITIKSYAMALPVGNQGSSGEALRSIAGTIIGNFLDRSFVRKVTLERGRLVLVLGGKEVTLGVSGGQMSISPDGKSVAGEISLDMLSGNDFAGRLTLVVSGNTKSPSIALNAECNDLDLTRLLALGVFRTDEIGTLAGQGSIALSYSAGQEGKDTILLSGGIEGLRMTTASFGSASLSSVRMKARYDSERCTYPDIESVVTSPWLYETDGFSGQFPGGVSTKFDSADFAVLMEKQVSFSCQAIDNLTLSKEGREFAAKALSLKASFSGSSVSLETSAQFSDGSRFDITGKLNDVFGETSGRLHCILYDVPQSFLDRVFNPSTIALEFAYEPVNGSIDVSIRGPKEADGSVALHTRMLTVKRNRKDLPGVEVTLSSEFRITDGALEFMRKTHLGLGESFDFEGSIEFAGGIPSKVSIDSLRIDSGFLSRAMAEIEPGSTKWKCDGRLDIRGDLSEFKGSFVPGRLNLSVSVVDEFSLAVTATQFSLLIVGVTGRVTLMGRETDNTRFFSLSGGFLPQGVTVNAKKLFLSGQKVTVSAEMKYSVSLDSLTIDVARLESDSGPREEITGDIRNLTGELNLNLKFRDWGLTLQQVSSLFEIPPGIKITSGNFILERTLTGTLANLESKYSINVNDLTFETRRVKLEGADILIEFP
ncbi:MAG: hypothetical protein WC712_06660 [Candidatus Brocadiia bacterium]